MPLTTVDAYGAPSYGAIGRPPAGVVFHTPENADHTLPQAINIAKWQATAGNTSGGSYHGILGYDAAKGSMVNPEAWVMVRSVPWNLAAGGLSGDHGAWHWNPDRYPWIRASLPLIAFNDPNRWMHQIAISGKAAWYVQNGFPLGLLIRVAEWVKTLEVAYGYDALLTLHRHWQTDRSDPGPLTFADQVMVEYDKLYNPPIPVPPKPRFSDVPFNHPAWKEIEWLALRGITTGTGGGKFSPLQNVTREQLAVMLYRAFGGVL